HASAGNAAGHNTLARRRPAHSGQVRAALRRHKPGDPLVGALRQTLKTGVSEPPLLPGPLRRLQRRAARLYLGMVRSRRLHRAVLMLFFVYALFVATSLTLLVTAWWSASPTGPATVARAGAAAADLLSLVMIAVGAPTLRRSRQGAYRWLERAVMVNLLVSQVFTFYLQQFGAIAGLAIDLILLLVLNGMIRTDRRAADHPGKKQAAAPPARCRPPGGRGVHRPH